MALLIEEEDSIGEVNKITDSRTFWFVKEYICFDDSGYPINCKFDYNLKRGNFFVSCKTFKIKKNFEDSVYKIEWKLGWCIYGWGLIGQLIDDPPSWETM